MDIVESRVKFLIGLLERCRDHLENEAGKDPIDFPDGLKDDEILNKYQHLARNEPQGLPNDSLSSAVQDFYTHKLHANSEIIRVKNIIT